MVNIDPNEMTKPHLRLDLAMAMDVREFMRELIESLPSGETFEHEFWNSVWREWKARYPLVTDDYLEDREHVNSDYLAHAISKVLTAEDVILTGDSLDAHSVFHSFAVTRGQRVVTNVNFGAMGWDLPALVGACVARKGRRVVLVTGDGSIEFNAQELLTVGAQSLNAIIFVLNNGGYQSICSTRDVLRGTAGGQRRTPRAFRLAHSLALEMLWNC